MSDKNSIDAPGGIQRKDRCGLPTVWQAPEVNLSARERRNLAKLRAAMQAADPLFVAAIVAAHENGAHARERMLVWIRAVTVFCLNGRELGRLQRVSYLTKLPVDCVRDEA